MAAADSPAIEAISASITVESPSESLPLKARIKAHYDQCSSYYSSLWGEHIHHGYFDPSSPDQTRESAQIALIDLLLSQSALTASSRVLDVGCGIGGTSRFLARTLGCAVTGLTISNEQVRMAFEMSGGFRDSDGFVKIAAESSEDNHDALIVAKKPGKVRFVELDAETMGDWFAAEQTAGKADSYDAVWISEALSHFPNKPLFFQNAARMLRAEGGKVVVADWFRDEDLSEEKVKQDIRPIEDGMLLPPLCTQSEYVAFAEEAGLAVYAAPMDISKRVSKTWDISINLVADPSLWALALTQGRDIIGFLKTFQAMRRAYANGSFRYAIIVFEKKGA
ncbi:hypothetical protein MMC10_001001 [Thelotrema lepadinum]|nr:hypothetical protein [Thelotrema lepadinum]